MDSFIFNSSMGREIYIGIYNIHSQLFHIHETIVIKDQYEFNSVECYHLPDLKDGDIKMALLKNHAGIISNINLPEYDLRFMNSFWGSDILSISYEFHPSALTYSDSRNYFIDQISGKLHRLHDICILNGMFVSIDWIKKFHAIKYNLFEYQEGNFIKDFPEKLSHILQLNDTIDIYTTNPEVNNNLDIVCPFNIMKSIYNNIDYTIDIYTSDKNGFPILKQTHKKQELLDMIESNRELYGDNEQYMYEYDYVPDKFIINDLSLNHNKNKYTVGLEIEVESPKTKRLQITYDLKNNYSNKEKLFYMVHDGSLENGIEIVTHPFKVNRIDGAEKIVKTLAPTLEYLNMNTTISNRCGLHIHIGRDGLMKNTLNKIQYIMIIW